MNVLAEALRSTSLVWATPLARASLEGGVALLLVWGLCRLWPTMPPALRPWLWRLAYAKLLLALICMPVVVPVLRAAQPMPVPTGARQAPSPATERVAAAIERTLVQAPAAIEALRVPPAGIRLASQPGLRGWLLLAWLVGVGLGLARLAYGATLLHRLRKSVRRVQVPSLAAHVAQWRARFGLGRAPQVAVSDGIGPLLLGPWRPLIVIPSSCVAEGTEAQLDAIVAHELAHLRRRDLQWTWLPALAEVLFFFHPLVWLARRELAVAQEIACDALVVDTGTATAASYADTLIWVMKNRRTEARPRVAVACIAESADTVARRITEMKRPAGTSRGWAAAAAALLMALGVIGLVEWHPAGVALGTPAAAAAQSVGQQPWLHPGSKAGEVIVGPDGGEMVWVPAGEFMMGTAGEPGGHGLRVAGEDAYAPERPVHRVRITKGFWLGRCTVTNAQYHRFCDETGTAFPQLRNNDGSVSSRIDYGDGHPVMFVTWYGAAAYCERYGLRLPTEAEWEYAARGSAGHVWPWGDEWDRGKCCNQENPGPEGFTFPVGSFPAGASWCGAMDMAGNGYQWCQDWYAADYYSKSPTDDPQGPSTPGPEPARVFRGGAPGNLRLGYSSMRVPGHPAANGMSRGFRSAVSPQ